jgi:SAM-dependent methyltransferase
MEKLFDLSEEYDNMLNEGLSISGENKLFFLEGRIDDLIRQIGDLSGIRRVLDFGCGIGDSTSMLAAKFPNSLEIVGTDLSDDALDYARSKHGSDRVSFVNLHGYSPSNEFDLCYVNGVFHHIKPEERNGAVELIYRGLTKGGLFALFENNPFNPGTQIIMSRIPFDRDAIKITPGACKEMVRKGGFNSFRPTRFLFYFPRMLSFLRFLEKSLARLPLGAQYYVLAEK